MGVGAMVINDKFTLTRKLGAKGESLGITIPPDMVEWIGAKDGDQISICADNGRFGKFLSLWVKKTEDVKNESA